MKTEIIINGIKYNLDLEKAKELGVLEKEDTICKSWDEFKKKYNSKIGYYFDTQCQRVEENHYPIATNEQLTKEEAIAIAAFSKLLKLRRDWIGDWEPNYTKNTEKYSIVYDSNLINILSTFYIVHPFSFPTKKMAKEFLKCFENLFNQCKNLI